MPRVSANIIICTCHVEIERINHKRYYNRTRVGFGAVNVIEKKKKRNFDNFISFSSEREHNIIILLYNTSIPIRRVENGFARKKEE